MNVRWPTILLPLLLCWNLSSAGSQVVGVSLEEYNGNRNPALRHRDCARTFEGSHWCSTREYLEGGIAEGAYADLPTAWVRPALIGGYLNDNGNTTLLDASGMRGGINGLSCAQWTCGREEDKGLALQTTRNNKKQKMILVNCDRKRPSLCCVNNPPG